MSRDEGRYPPRPAVPVALWCLVMAWIAVWITGHVSLGVPAHVLAMACGWACAASLVALAIAARICASAGHEPPPVALVAACVMLAATASACHAFESRAETRDALCSSSAGDWTFEACDDPKATEQGFRVRAKALGARSRGGAVWLLSSERIGRGEEVRIVGRVLPLDDSAYGRSSWAQGVCASVRAVRIREKREPRGLLAGVLRLRAAMQACFDRCDPDVAAVLGGCLCGDRERLDERGLGDVFAACGVAHMMAVSGAHLAVIGSVVAAVLEKTAMGPQVRLGTQSLILGCYVLVCGAPVSALRAWAMTTASGVGSVVGRRTHATSSASVVALSMVLSTPTVAARLGFCLSVVSVVGLSLLCPHAAYLLRTLVPAPLLSRRLDYATRRQILGVYDAAVGCWAATIVCQLVTLPFVASAFGRLSLLAPLANMVAMPLVQAVMALGMAAACLGATPIAIPVLSVCSVPCHLLLRWLRLLAGVPLCTVSVSSDSAVVSFASLAIATAWLLWWPRISRRQMLQVMTALLVAYALWFARARYLAPARLVVLDVGQGDAILIQDGAHALLVDTGPDASVAAALQRQHVVHLDAVLLTHLHDDHYGGIDDLVGVVGCDAVLVARGVREAMADDLRQACHDLCTREVVELSYGDVVHVGGYELKMVWPHDVVDGDENAESIELLLERDGGEGRFSALLTGDAERDETRACVACGDVGDIDVLKVGHHGSEVSLDDATARVLSPEVSIASAGEGNSYGHPTKECREVLAQVDSHFYCTIDVGDVEVRPCPKGLLVRTERVASAA